MSSQKLFLKNIGPNDMHVMLYLKEILIGYVCLRKQNFSLKMKQKIIFDTCIIKKQFRRKNYTKLLMNFTNKVIENSKCISILYCEKISNFLQEIWMENIKKSEQFYSAAKKNYYEIQLKIIFFLLFVYFSLFRIILNIFNSHFKLKLNLI